VVTEGLIRVEDTLHTVVRDHLDPLGVRIVKPERGRQGGSGLIGHTSA
jgi:hypothetical protein